MALKATENVQCTMRRKPRAQKSSCLSLRIQQQTEFTKINGKTVELFMRLLKVGVCLKN